MSCLKGRAPLAAQIGRRADEALLYARAALENFRQADPGAADMVTRAGQLITELEQRTQNDPN